MTELMVVLSIVAILSVALGFAYQGWMGSYKVEGAVKQLYADLMGARALAMQTNRAHFMDISPNGMFYRVTQDDSNGIADVADGDGIFNQQDTWTNIQASSPLSWGGDVITTDDTVTSLSSKIVVTSNTTTGAGLLSARNVPQGAYSFALGFDKRGMIKNMRGTGGALPRTNISDPLNIFPTTQGGGLSICIFTDYDNDQTSDYNPDFDCINIMDTKIVLGKLTVQNTAGGTCDAANCIAK